MLNQMLPCNQPIDVLQKAFKKQTTITRKYLNKANTIKLLKQAKLELDQSIEEIGDIDKFEIRLRNSALNLKDFKMPSMTQAREESTLSPDDDEDASTYKSSMKQQE